MDSEEFKKDGVNFIVEDLDYSIVAKCRDHDVIFYERYGSYQGEWLMVSIYDREAFIWKGSYGSCGGCDHLEGSLDSEHEEIEKGKWRHIVSKKDVIEFSYNYLPFLTLDFTDLVDACATDNLLSILPRNIRTWLTDEYRDLENVAEDIKKAALEHNDGLKK